MSGQITIYCAEASHASDPYVVASFLPGDVVFGDDVSLPWQDWQEGAQVNDDTNDWGIETAPNARRTGALLDGDAFTAERRDRWGNNETLFRERFSLRCARCGLSTPARSEKLFPILDKLRRAGIPGISLSALGPRLE